MLNLLPLIQQFAASLTQNYASSVPGQPEDQLKPHVKALVEAAGKEFKKGVLLRSESRVEGLGGRPDFGVEVDGLLCGHIELKAPGLGARPQKFAAKSRDAAQWQKFKSLPNLIYTDGNEWTHFHEGKPVATFKLAGDVRTDGAAAASEKDGAALDAMLRAFLKWEPIVPSKPRELAKLLAPLCRFIRADVQAAIADEHSSLSLLAKEWRAALFPDADDAKFADAYAQTLTYGLLLARVEGQQQLTTDNAASALDANHGLLASALRVLVSADVREELGAGLGILLRVLNALKAELWAAKKAGDEDPWLYFYEDFLAEYDPRLRADAGVYYTPVPVIKAQVRLIDELLRTRFNKKKGFNEPGVNVLDPAAGTGAYPLAVLENALAAAASRGPAKVAEAATDLAQRLHAFEFLVGPYAVAHLRLTQAVRAAGGHLAKEGALVYLCDTLDSPYVPAQKTTAVRKLAEEHERARKVKNSTPVLVCLGNPPYDRQQSDDPEESRRGGWIRFGDTSADRAAQTPKLESFLAPARDAGYGRYLANLYNDYVYFWRWALWKAFENAEAGGEHGGIVCFITASSYLGGPGFVGMRQAMRETFDELWILDLEGESRGARPTENVFNIQTGVAIAIGVRLGAGDKTKPAHVRYAKMTGTRAEKFAALDALQVLADVEWRDCSSDWLAPFKPVSEAIYHQWPALTDVFPVQYPGVKCHRTWPIGETPELLEERWKKLVAAPSKEKPVLFRDTESRKVATSYRKERNSPQLPAIASLPSNAPAPPIARYAFRSFDRQWIFDDIRISDRFRPPLWKSYSSSQIFLTSLLTDVLGSGPSATVTAHIPDLHHFSGRGGKDVIPLWRDAEASEANVTAGLLKYLGEALGREVSAPDLFAYCYALLTPRAYAKTFAEELLTPGPRIPLTRSPELFAQVVSCGHDLIRAHTFGERDLESSDPSGEVEQGSAQYTKPISPEPDKYPEEYFYDPTKKTLHVGDGTFSPVEPEVWHYSVSGLRVVRSWLDYRKKERNGRKSSPLDDIRPEAWTSALSDELQDLLWTLERTLEIEPHAESLLLQVLEGDLIAASELPTPTKAERDAPASGANAAQPSFDMEAAEIPDAP